MLRAQKRRSTRECRAREAVFEPQIATQPLDAAMAPSVAMFTDKEADVRCLSVFRGATRKIERHRMATRNDIIRPIDRTARVSICYNAMRQKTHPADRPAECICAACRSERMSRRCYRGAVLPHGGRVRGGAAHAMGRRGKKCMIITFIPR